MSERLNKTVLSSVIFLDIVDYSEQPDSIQINLKERFKTLLGEVLNRVAPDDRIMLDTGDGAAIALLGAPEEALFVVLAIHDVILKDNRHHADALVVRAGVNLGPVRIVTDVNGHPNILGDGINVAQRVMSFAGPNQILVSRTYYEIVSRISSETLSLFSYSGIKTDKHVREHEVYAIRTADGKGPPQAPAKVAQRQPSHRKLAVVSGVLVLAGAMVVWLLWAKTQPPSVSTLASGVTPAPLVTKSNKKASAKSDAMTDKASASQEASSEGQGQTRGNEPQKPEQKKQAQDGISVKHVWDDVKQSLPKGRKAPCSDNERALGQCG